MPSSIRKKQRPSYSCTECTRRKLRCSKHIPCSACVERGIGQECHRRSQASQATPRRGSTSTPRRNQSSTRSSTLQSDISVTASPLEVEHTPYLPRHNAVEGVGQDAAVMLEFLALSRRQVLQDAHVDQAQLPETECPVDGTAELLFTAEQVDRMMIYHQECLAWTHNVVHLPTFRSQCDAHMAGDILFDGTWVALYYAMIAVSVLPFLLWTSAYMVYRSLCIIPIHPS